MAQIIFFILYDGKNTHFSDNEILNAEIVNIDGQLVKSISGNFSNIGINDLSNGLYFVNVYTENGKETHKFIKK